MPISIDREQVTSYLQRFLTHNKARGMVAELALNTEIGLKDNPADQKLLSGGWIISPKVSTPQYYRYMVSVLPHLYNNPDELQTAIDALENDRG